MLRKLINPALPACSRLFISRINPLKKPKGFPYLKPSSLRLFSVSKANTSDIHKARIISTGEKTGITIGESYSELKKHKNSINIIRSDCIPKLQSNLHHDYKLLAGYAESIATAIEWRIDNKMNLTNSPDLESIVKMVLNTFSNFESVVYRIQPNKEAQEAIDFIRLAYKDCFDDTNDNELQSALNSKYITI